MSNPKRRESDGSLIADLRRRVSRLEQRRTPAGAKKLDDLSDVAVPTPATNDVLTFTGAQWVNAPSVAGDIAVSEAIATFDNSEDPVFAFDEVGDDSWESPAFVVAPNSYQVVLVTIDVSVSDTVIGLFLNTDDVGRDVGFPTPWKATVFASDLPGVTYLGNGSGSCGITVPLWLRNETDTEASMSVTVIVSGVATSFVSDGFDGTVLVRAESVFQMAAIP